MILTTRLRNFLKAIAGERPTPDPESSMEITLKNIADRLNRQLLPVPADEDVGKVPVVKADKSYEFSDAPFELPDVTTADNGKTMLVESGVWALARDLYIVEIIETETIEDEQSVFVYSADKTYQEIKALMDAGKKVLAHFRGAYAFISRAEENNNSDLYALFPAYDNASIRVKISTITPVPGGISITSVEVNPITYELATKVVIITDNEAVISPQVNTLYKCANENGMVSLTIVNPPAEGDWGIVFTSGGVATTTTIDASILGLESFAADVNTIYEINVSDSRAVYTGWGVTTGSK